MRNACSMVGCKTAPSHRVRVKFEPQPGKPLQTDFEKDYCRPHALYTKDLIETVAKVPLTVDIAALA
jgi:hypothetical protein